MFALVVNDKNRKYAVVPSSLAHAKLPDGWEIDAEKDSEGLLLRHKMYPQCTWRDYTRVSDSWFKEQDFAPIYETIEVETTKSGTPALWESGGGMSSRGGSQIICDSKGWKKKPIFIRTHGHLANENHALFVLNKGDYVIQVSNKEGGCKIYRVVKFQNEPIKDPFWDDDILGFDFLADLARMRGEIAPKSKAEEPKQKLYAYCELVAEKNGSSWWPELEEKLETAYNVAVDKANTYHCKRPMYVKK